MIRRLYERIVRPCNVLEGFAEIISFFALLMPVSKLGDQKTIRTNSTSIRCTGKLCSNHFFFFALLMPLFKLGDLEELFSKINHWPKYSYVQLVKQELVPWSIVAVFPPSNHTFWHNRNGNWHEPPPPLPQRLT